MKKILSLLLALCLFCGIFSGITVSAAETEVVAVSEDIEYVLADGVLTISGSGDIPDYGFEEAPWFKYATEAKKVVIESGITAIGDTAFCDFTAMEEIEIPDTVTRIGMNSFSGCGLLGIYLPKSIAEIDEMPFVNCDRMAKYTVDPENPYFCNSEDGVLFSKDMTVLVAYPLSTEATEYTVPDTVVEIKGYAFSRVPMLENVTFGENVKSIGDECFFNCPNLTNVYFNDVLEYIGGGAFQHCTKINEFVLPSTISKIRPLAFWDTGYYNTRSNWEDDLLYIGEYLITGEYYPASDECEDPVEKFAIGDIVIKDGTVLVASDAFSWFAYDPEIYSVTFPLTMRFINEYAFYGCNQLVKVELDGNMEWIDDYAFYNCKNLADVVLGDNIKRIGAVAFMNTAYANNTENYTDGFLYNNKYLLGYTGSLPTEIEIKEGTTLIAGKALAAGGTYYTHTVKLPESLEIICEMAFLGTNTGEFEIPATVTYIGDYAIGYRYIASTDEYVLIENSSIKAEPETEAERYAQEFLLEFKNSLAVPQFTFGCYTANIVDGELVIVDFEWDSSYSSDVTIPVAESGMTITGIASGAFKDCSGLTSISIHEYVTYIGENAFANCENVLFTFNCGTVAHKYAEANGLNYEAECQFPADTDKDGIVNTCSGCGITQCEVFGHIMNSMADIDYVNECIRDGCDYISTSFGPGYTENGYLFGLSEDNKAKIVKADETITGYVEIPATLGGGKVTEIAAGAFKDCTGITDIVLPESIVYVGDADFGDNDDVLIHCKCSSYGKTYAFRNGLRYETYGCEWKPADCKNPETCELCGTTQGEALGHTEVIDEAVPPTCTETGLTQGSHCSVCGETIVYQYTEYSKGHTYTEEITKEPTCNSFGTVVYTCEVCGDSYEKTLQPVYGHSTQWEEKEATYFEAGYTGRVTCKICGEVINEGEIVKQLKLKAPKVTYKAGKKKFTVKYTKVTDATGFEVKYKLGKKTVTKTYKTKKTVSKVIKNLKKGSYKVQVRAYVKQGKKIAYSSWTKAKTVKVK